MVGPKRHLGMEGSELWTLKVDTSALSLLPLEEPRCEEKDHDVEDGVAELLGQRSALQDHS